MPRHLTRIAGAAALALLPAMAAAQETVGAGKSYTAHWPLYYMNGAGPQAERIAWLLWGLFGLSIFVILVISTLVGIGVLSRRTRGEIGDWPQPYEGDGEALGWIWSGIGVTVVILCGFIFWTVWDINAIAAPSSKPAFTVHVIGHQWWWEVRYVSDEHPNEDFTTANEIHIPVGVPVEVVLNSADVIHSFWVPSLAGKTDMIPGLTNHQWLQADRPGVYWGQCMEYCGREHAKMSFRVVAQSPDDFAKWAKHEIQPAAPPQDGTAAAAGYQVFNDKCSVCHAVEGDTYAKGRLGPNLTHVMSRQTLAAGILINNVGNLSGWIANPQEIKPGSKMPNLDLSGPQLDKVRAYVKTLD